MLSWTPKSALGITPSRLVKQWFSLIVCFTIDLHLCFRRYMGGYPMVMNHYSDLSLLHCDSSASTIISVVYGKPLSSNNAETSTSTNDCSPELHITSNALDTLSNIAHRYTNAVYPGAHLVEVFPILDLLPDVIAKWKRKAKQDFRKISDIFEKYFADSVEFLWFTKLITPHLVAPSYLS